MIGVLLFFWFALAVIFTWGFYLVRRHYQSLSDDAYRHHPMWGNSAENYDWDKEDDA